MDCTSGWQRSLQSTKPNRTPAWVKRSHTCSGSLKNPGVLKGSYPNGVVVKGFCVVKSGRAHVIGTLTVTKGATLAAAFGLHGSALKVSGNLVVDQGGAAVLGCKVNADGSGAACLDDPNMKHPTLKSHEVVTGSVTENAPLGVIVHNSMIGGNLTVFCSLLGTPYQPSFKSAIPFFEEIDEKPRKIDAHLAQLQLAGLFDEAKAILLGQFTNCDRDEDAPTLSLREVFDDYFSKLNVPVISGLPFGHEKQMWTLPYGARLQIAQGGEQMTLSVMESVLS